MSGQAAKLASRDVLDLPIKQDHCGLIEDAKLTVSPEAYAALSMRRHSRMTVARGP